jgi:hypothetical protein
MSRSYTSYRPMRLHGVWPDHFTLPLAKLIVRIIKYSTSLVTCFDAKNHHQANLVSVLRQNFYLKILVDWIYLWTYIYIYIISILNKS